MILSVVLTIKKLGAPWIVGPWHWFLNSSVFISSAPAWAYVRAAGKSCLDSDVIDGKMPNTAKRYKVVF
jgi:hypothetical protein